MAEAVGSSRERGEGRKGRDAGKVPTWGVMLARRGGLREAPPDWRRAEGGPALSGTRVSFQSPVDVKTLCPSEAHSVSAVRSLMWANCGMRGPDNHWGAAAWGSGTSSQEWELSWTSEEAGTLREGNRCSRQEEMCKQRQGEKDSQICLGSREQQEINWDELAWQLRFKRRDLTSWVTGKLFAGFEEMVKGCFKKP